MDRHQNCRPTAKRPDLSRFNIVNQDNKENINPYSHITVKREEINRIEEDESNQMDVDHPLEDKYRLLKRKVQRPEDDHDFLKSRIENNNLIQNAKRNFSNNLAQSKYSFKVDSLPLKFRVRHVLKYRPEKKIVLKIIKSNVKLMVLNTSYFITERGIDCSQKTHDTHYISIGRQQVNDQGIRPNDIMLFPTDPSISRSHLKIFHKDFFRKMKEFNSQLFSFQMLTHQRLCKDSRLTTQEVFNIMKYISPPSQVGIEDNGTIYGTFVKIRPFTAENFLTNFFMNFKTNFQLPAEENKFLDNFPLSATIDNLKQHDSVLNVHLKELFDYVYSKKCLIEEVFNWNFKPNDEFYTRRLNKAVRILNKNNMTTDRENLLQNNFVIDKHLPAVFLNNHKAGFNLIQTGTMPEIVEALRKEYFAFNEEYFLPTVDVISNDKVFDFQKLDASSQMFKATITTLDLVNNYQFDSVLANYSLLLLIETSGDPCGVMNRVNDVLFLSDRKGNFDNKRCFSFNFVKGFLVGSNAKSCHYMNSETDAFIYYNWSVDKWMITDLTKFTNPAVYYSEDFFGLWMCISEDKLNNSRYTPKVYYVKSGDQIKVSETVMQVTIQDQ